MAAAEAVDQNVKPLPPMTGDECMEYLIRLIDTAAGRPLMSAECFVFGQLLAQFRQASWVEAMGIKERCYVIPEAHIDAYLQKLRETLGS